MLSSSTMTGALRGAALLVLAGFAFLAGHRWKRSTPDCGSGLVQVKSCHDGDTCTVVARVGTESLTFRVRLAGIDAPEVPSRRRFSQGQPFGAEAAQRLNGLVGGQSVAIHQIALDHFNRPIVELRKGSTNVGITLLSEGLTEVYRHPSPGLDEGLYHQTEQSAKDERRGIWSQATPESPAAFRKRQAH